MTNDDLAAIAAGAPTVARVRRFVDWVGTGRALTHTGRLRRVDALALVEPLKTGEILDRRFPIQSSAELYRSTLRSSGPRRVASFALRADGSSRCASTLSCSSGRPSSSAACS